MKHTLIQLPSNPNLVPACEACGASTRLVGLEESPSGLRGEIATYQCMMCANVQAHSHARSPAEK
jgi:hypothetical protein